MLPAGSSFTPNGGPGTVARRPESSINPLARRQRRRHATIRARNDAGWQVADYRLGRDRGSPNDGSTLFSNRVIGQILFPSARRLTRAEAQRRMTPGGQVGDVGQMIAEVHRVSNFVFDDAGTQSEDSGADDAITAEGSEQLLILADRDTGEGLVVHLCRDRQAYDDFAARRAELTALVEQQGVKISPTQFYEVIRS
jgi:hypothetical protein